jgi:23S rRNA (guanosine2251-2'-O)-methyltransferase
MVFGIRAIMEAIFRVKKLRHYTFSAGLAAAYRTNYALLNEYNITAQQVPVEKLNRFTMKNHQGAVAFISPITYQKIEDIIPQFLKKERCR